MNLVGIDVIACARCGRDPRGERGYPMSGVDVTDVTGIVDAAISMGLCVGIALSDCRPDVLMRFDTEHDLCGRVVGIIRNAMVGTMVSDSPEVDHATRFRRMIEKVIEAAEVS